MSSRRLLLIALLFAFAAPSWSPARAAGPCLGMAQMPGAGGSSSGGEGSSGMGGTGFGGDGMGGTGLSGGRDGMGGTGVGGDGDGEDGMGGTGILAAEDVGVLGMITGFGSICVNGERIRYDADTPVEQDGAPAAARSLAVGQVVSVRARNENGVLRAERIAIRRAVVGPVTRVDAARGRLYVMGKAVIVPQGGIVYDAAASRPAALASIDIGTRVAVSGFHRADGVLVASRVESDVPGSAASVTGPAQLLAHATLAVGEVRVRVAQADIESAPGFARARGHWNAARGTLEAERVEAVGSFDAPVGRVSVEGFVRERRDGRFRLSGLPVDGSAVADRLGSVPRDARVVIEGPLDADGVVRAERIRVSVGRFDEGPRVGAEDLGAAADDREDRGDREDREDRGDRGDREGRAERAERPERAERAERPERPDRSGRR